MFEYELAILKCFGPRHVKGRLLYDMILFVNRYNACVAYWAFSWGQCLKIEKGVTWPSMVLAFERHLFPVWEVVEMHIGCRFKNKQKGPNIKQLVYKC